jgi:hypothetical protein
MESEPKPYIFHLTRFPYANRIHFARKRYGLAMLIARGGVSFSRLAARGVASNPGKCS